MAKIEFDTIPPDALIDIKISGAFYRRMVELITMMGESVPLEEFKAIIEKLKDNNPSSDMFEFNVHTLICLIYEVEKEAKAQNKTVKADMDIPDEVATGN